MTTEEKELLLKDLSARLPYGVKCKVDCFAAKIFSVKNACGKLASVSAIVPGTSITRAIKIEDVRLFLFPLSSMTEEQIIEFNNLTTEYSFVTMDDMAICIDWLNANHFDFRGLLEKGLAIDATELNIY